ncbi:unnamed protein product, partial [marine sediment metagenome]
LRQSNCIRWDADIRQDGGVEEREKAGSSALWRSVFPELQEIPEQ